MASKEPSEKQQNPGEMLLTLAQSISPGVYRFGNDRLLTVATGVRKKRPTAIVEIFEPQVGLFDTGVNGWDSHRVTVTKKRIGPVQATETRRIIWEKEKGISIELIPTTEEAADTPVDLARYVDSLSAVKVEGKVTGGLKETDIGEPVKIGQYLSARIKTFLTQENVTLQPTEVPAEEQQFITFARGETVEEDRDGIVTFDRGTHEVELETVDLRQPPAAFVAEARRPIGEHHVTVSQYRGRISFDSIIFDFKDGGQRTFVINYPPENLQEIDLKQTDEGNARPNASPADCIFVVDVLDALIRDQDFPREFSPDAPVDP